jgi:hypothetical protein
MKGILFGITSGMRGVIVLMTGMPFRAFVEALGSISANCRRLSHMGKQEVTLHKKCSML